jgi:hypothetical protein
VSFGEQCVVKNVFKIGAKRDMFQTDQVEYPVKDANYQRNSFIAPVSRAVGKLKWKKAYVEIDKLMRLLVHSLLHYRDVLGIVSNNDLLIFDIDGNFKYKIPIALHTPVILGSNAFASLNPAHLMEYRNYNGKKILEHKDIHLDDCAILELLLPTDKTITAAIQSNGGPERLPPEFTLFQEPIEKQYPTWDMKRDKRNVGPVVVTKSNSTILVNERTHCSVVDMKSGVTSTFKVSAVQDIISMSLNLDNDLVIFGTVEKDGQLQTMVVVSDLKGLVHWSYPLDSLKIFQPPVCGPNGRVYVVDGSELLCIEKGILMWRHHVATGYKVQMTVTSDNQVICINSLFLTCFDKFGKVVFNEILGLDPSQEFDAPPCIDNRGRIYCSSSEFLFCYE